MTIGFNSTSSNKCLYHLAFIKNFSSKCNVFRANTIYTPDMEHSSADTVFSFHVRDWQRYAERTADYAFGMAGDQDMARNQRYWPLWRKVEGLGEDQKGQEDRGLKMC